MVAVNHTDALNCFNAIRARQFYPKADCSISNDVLRSLKRNEEPRNVTTKKINLIFEQNLQQQVSSIEFLPVTGTFHALYKVKLTDDSLWVFRVNKLPNNFQDLGLELEQQVTDLVQEKLGGIAAYIKVADSSRTEFGFDYQIVEWISGKTIKSYDDQEPIMTALLEQYAAILAKVHSIKMKHYGLLSSSLQGTRLSWRDYITNNLHEHLHYLFENNLITVTEHEKCNRIFQKSEKLFNAIDPCLLHGDPSSHNAFTDGKSITKIIDWEDSLAGDPLYELAFFASFHPQRRWKHVFSAYKNTMGEIEARDELFWIYYLRIAITKAVIRHRFAYPDVPGQEPASGRIRLALAAVSEKRSLEEVA